MSRLHWLSGMVSAAIVFVVAGSAPAAHIGKSSGHADQGHSAHQSQSAHHGQSANHDEHRSSGNHHSSGNDYLVAHGGGGGGGGGGHSMGGGHSFGGGGSSHAFSGGGSHSFSGGGSHSFGGPSISHSFSGGSSHSFAPQSFSRGSSNWAGGQSNWQHGLGSSAWQSARNTSNWNQHLGDWNRGQQWSHSNNWWGNSNWAGNNNWWHNGNWWGRNWWWGNNGFAYYPAFTFGAALAFPWWYDNYYPSYDYYPAYGYATPYNDSAPYAYGSAPYAATTALVSQPDVVQTQYAEDPQPTQPAASSDAGGEYFAEATAAFRSGQYRDALRLANHAAVESPQNAKAHELMSLAMFALADYRGAAAEAHAALAFAPPAAWSTVYTYYGNDAPYTNQLRALEKYSRENPTAADARFLRAYEYLMLGHERQALDQLRDATKLEPQDRLAAELLKRYGEPASDRQAPPAPSPIPANPGGGVRSVDGGVDS